MKGDVVIIMKKIKAMITAVIIVVLIGAALLPPTPVMANNTAAATNARKQLKDVRLVIDPGHGGNDSGARAMHNGVQIRESDLVLDVSLRLESLLRPTGINVSMTRSRDVTVSLADRTRMANQQGADLFVSIHANSFSDPAANGIETFFFGTGARSNASTHHGIDPFMIQPASTTRVQDSQLLAERIQARLVEKLKLRNRGAKQGNFHVIRETNMAAVLTELGFLSNAEDRSMIVSQSGRDLSAEAVYLGILDYLVVKGYDVPSSLFNIGSTAPPPAPAPPAVTSTTREGQTIGSVNFRRGAGTNHAIIRKLSRNTRLTILSESNGWMRVRIGNQEGFVSSRYVQVTTREGQTISSVNFRRGAGTNQAIIRKLSRNTKLTILAESNGWMRVRIGNQEGFISSKYVQVTTRLGQTTSRVNFRRGAGTNHNVIRMLSKGTNFTILGERNGWMRVRIGNQEGFISSKYARVVTRPGQTTARVNFRRGAGTNHGVISTLPKGRSVTILGESNGWTRVRVGKQEGFVSSNYVRTTAARTSNTSVRTGTTTAALNMRAGAGTNHRVIRTLARGTKVTILSESNGWMRVRVGNQEGFVSANFVRR